MTNKYIDKEILEFIKPYSTSRSMQDGEISELYKLAQEVDGDILEIGAYRGRSTIVLAKGTEKGNKCKVTTIEPFIAHGEIEENKTTCLNYWKRAEVNINLIQDYSDNVDPNQFKDLGLLLIDANHTYECVKRDFLRFSPCVKEGGYIVLHDFHLPGIKQAFDEVIYPDIVKGYCEFRVVESLIVLKKLSWEKAKNE